MSDITSILLPRAQVDFFALDDGTASSAEKIAQDWRFARVNVNINRGGIEQAVEQYTQYASPELIIIETNDISDAFIERLGALSGVCAEGTDAVIIGPMNDVHLYRSLVGMGVRDYLVRPVPDEDLVGVIAKSLVDKRGLAHSRIVAVMGAKGGVGATSVAQMLSVSIARDLKQKTLLMDLAGTGGSLGVGFGLEPTTSLTEALRVGASGSDDDMRRILQASGDNLSVIVTGGEALLNDSPDPDAVEALLNRVMQKNPVVVVDLSSASHAVRKRVLSLAAHTVLVATPLLPPLRNARTLLTEIKSMRGKQVDLDLVVNMIGMAGGDEVPLKDIKAALDLEPALKITYQPKIFAHAEATGKPVAEAKGAQEIMAALLPVAARAAKAEVEAKEDGKGKKGGLGLFRGLGKK